MVMFDAAMSRRALLGTALASAGAAAPTMLQAGESSTEVASLARLAVSISQADLDKAFVIASPSRFAGIDPTGGSDSAAGLQAAINATPDAGTLVIPRGTYLMNSAVYPKLGRSINIVAYGAKLIQNSSQPIISLSGDYGPVIGVVGLSTVTPTGLGPQSKLTLATAPGWGAGDVIKVVSDDVIPEGRPGPGDGTESRLGEFAVVRSVNGKTVSLNGVLREAYSTNVRAARISRQTISIEGGEFETAPARMAAANSALLYFGRLFAPRLSSVRVNQAGGIAMQFVSCFGYRVQDAQVDRAVDDPATGQFGYGILDNACAHGLILGGVFRHVRHAYTDDTSRVAANSDPTGYGRTYGTTVSGVSALMTTNGSFDTHHCSENVAFIGCSATGGISQGQGQYGFQLRGKAHRVVACTATGTDGGLQIFTETGGGESRGHTISDFRARATRGAAVRVAVRPTGHPKAGRRDADTAEIRGLSADSCASLLVAYNASIVLSDATYRAPAGSDGTNVQGVFVDNCDLDLRDAVFDYTTNAAGTPRVISSGQSPGTDPGRQDTALRDVEIRATAEVAARTWGAINGPAHLVRGRGLRFTYPFRLMAGEGLAEGSLIEWQCDHVDGVTEGLISSSTFAFGNSDLPAVLARVNQSPDPALYLRGRSTVDITAPALPAGRILGQRLLIHYAGSRSLTLPNGPSFRMQSASGADVVLAGNGRVQLFWDGTVWQEL